MCHLTGLRPDQSHILPAREVAHSLFTPTGSQHCHRRSSRAVVFLRRSSVKPGRKQSPLLQMRNRPFGGTLARRNAIGNANAPIGSASDKQPWMCRQVTLDRRHLFHMA
jgi:hypothetical protein